MKNVVVFGAGGHAKVIADIIKLEGNRVVAFLDDNINLPISNGPINSFDKYLDCEFIIGIGENAVREKLSKLNVKWHTAIHPRAIVSKSAVLGEGTVVMAGAIVNPNARIGKHCIINTGSIIEHDNLIGNFTHVSVGAKLGGTVVVGNNVFIGIGSVIKNNVSITKKSIIGAGAVVIHNIEKEGIYVGVPARLKEDK